MNNDALIELGLHSISRTSQIDPVFRASLEKLFALLRDVAVDFTEAVDDLADGSLLRKRLEDCIGAIASARDWQTIAVLVEGCCDDCRQVLMTIEGQQLQHGRELASLLGVLQQALLAVGGDADGFNTELQSSMGRFETLSRLDDLHQLKTGLAKEVGTLRRLAVQRQEKWEVTRAEFSERIVALEQRLLASRAEAGIDALTQIANRGAFDATINEWLKFGRSTFVLALIDVDNFKGVNDTYGHPAGDRVLSAVAQALKASVRSGTTDVVARIGGDEFACLMRDVVLRQAEKRLQMFVTAQASIELTSMDGRLFKVSASCGLAEFAAGDTAESLLHRSDRALYEAKRRGKNRVIATTKPTLREMLRG